MKYYLFSIISLIFIFSTTARAGGNSESCRTQYPVVLAQGIYALDGDTRASSYWRDIVDALEDKGADVYCTVVMPEDDIEKQALDFKTQLLQVLAISNSTKANIIGHSYGGIYTRHAVANLGIGLKVASHTSCSSPHRGTYLADLMAGQDVETLSFIFNGTGALDEIKNFIDGNKNYYQSQIMPLFSRSFMNEVFNPAVPDDPWIFYQSYGVILKNNAHEKDELSAWSLLKSFEGENDGLVSVESVQWGYFRGIESGAWWSNGISHFNVVSHLKGIPPGFSREDYFTRIVCDLRNRGF